MSKKEAQLKRTSQIRNGQVHQWRGFYDIFTLIDSEIAWKGMGKNKKYGDKEVVFEKFFDSNVKFFFKLQDLINTPYLVSKYTDDIILSTSIDPQDGEVSPFHQI